MPNRKTGLDFSVFSMGGTAYIGDIENAEVTVQNKTAEGKGVADIDDFAVLVGRKTTVSGRLMINTSSGTAQLAGLATSSTPVGSVNVTTGAGGGFSGTAVITEWKWRGAREEIQMVDVSMEFRGAVPFV